MTSQTLQRTRVLLLILHHLVQHLRVRLSRISLDHRLSLRLSPPGVRKVLDDVHAEAVKRGLDIGYIPGHLPLRMDPDQINTNRSQFLQDITPYFESPEAANKAVDSYMEMIARTEDPGAAPLISRLVNEDTTPGS